MRVVAALLCLSLAACPQGAPRVSPPDPHGADAGLQTAGCKSDSACGAGQVCVNCGGVGECTPGCRENSQCGSREICQLGTACQTCPCPPGWCVLNPCRDEDGDGYVPGNDATVTCPGKQKGDCDDRQPKQNPGAQELCENFQDDNCDEKVDERDPTCVCSGAKPRCGSVWECGSPGAQTCNKGCCDQCRNNENKPSCPNGCAQRYGINPYDGCAYGWTCDHCSSCPSTVDPVCAVNGSTYDNECLMRLRFTTLLHRGACLPGETMYCQLNGGVGFDGGCGPSGQMYCRTSCPTGQSCNFSQCTQKGVCLRDSDCPAGLAPPPPADCDGGTAKLSCISNSCVSVCR